MKKILLFTLFFISTQLQAVEVMLWVSKENMPTITSEKPLEYWYRNGFYDGPCGWVLTKEVSQLPPSSSIDFVKGSEKVFEVDEKGNVLNQWAMPVDSYVYAISKTDLFVRWNKSALKISTSGNVVESKQKYVPAKNANCKNQLKSIYGDSAYVRCSEHTDLQNKKPRLLIYEGVCT